MAMKSSSDNWCSMFNVRIAGENLGSISLHGTDSLYVTS